MQIYLVTNKINGKHYVGQTTQALQDRWSMHCSESSRCTALSEAIAIWGVENFTIETIRLTKDEQELSVLEIELISHYNSLYPNGYNLNKGGTRPKFSEASRKRMSESAKLRRPISEKTRRKLSLARIGEKNHNFGKRFSEEHRANLSKSHLGIIAGMSGKSHSAKTRKKMSTAKKGKTPWNKGLKVLK